MRLPAFFPVLALACASLGAGGSPFTALHPEEAYPDDPQQASVDQYTPLIRAMQERLRYYGFNAGPVNGDMGGKTQAALAQFQIANSIPASGALDDATLKALGLSRGDTPSPQSPTGRPPEQAIGSR